MPTSTVTQRRYPRRKAPKGLCVAWQTSGRRAVSYVQTMGMGGLFIRTKQPVAVGTMIQLLIDLPSGEVRGRGIVRSVKAREGMGVGIVSMNPEDRARLNNFLGKLPA